MGGDSGFSLRNRTTMLEMLLNEDNNHSNKDKKDDYLIVNELNNKGIHLPSAKTTNLFAMSDRY
jgi:hypothetical protein